MMHVRKNRNVGHGAVLSLNIIKIRESLQIGAQMRTVERTFETLPLEAMITRNSISMKDRCVGFFCF